MTDPLRWTATQELQHAVASSDVAAAGERGWTEALCGRRLPVDVELLSEPAPELCCVACVIGVTADCATPPATRDVPLPPLAPFEGPAGTADGGAASICRTEAVHG